MKFILFVLLTFVSVAQAASDPYNTYQWNRENASKGNGKIDKEGWFEWWFYKVVDPQTREAFYFVYGVVNPWDKSKTLKGTTAFIQAGDFTTMDLTERLYPISEFSASYSNTKVVIEPGYANENHATENEISGHIFNSAGKEIQWSLNIEHDWAFNAMGWGLSHPELSGIYWYPAQASAYMSGWVKYGDRVVNFVNAPAYQDRNWGRSFPKWWTWLTSNSFKNSPGTVLAAGGGSPKIFDKLYFWQGLCIGLRHEGQEHTFRSTDGDQIKFNIKWGTWEVTATNRKLERIEISAYAPSESFLILPFRSPEGSIFYDYEALLGHMNVKLSKWSKASQTWETVANLETFEAGIEWGTPTPLNSIRDIQLTGP